MAVSTCCLQTWNRKLVCWLISHIALWLMLGADEVSGNLLVTSHHQMHCYWWSLNLLWLVAMVHTTLYYILLYFAFHFAFLFSSHSILVWFAVIPFLTFNYNFFFYNLIIRSSHDIRRALKVSILIKIFSIHYIHTLCEWHSWGYDCTHSCCLHFGFAGFAQKQALSLIGGCTIRRLTYANE